MHYFSSVKNQKWGWRAKNFMFSRGFYAFKAPPVCTNLWDSGSWIKFIDAYNGWKPPWAEVKGDVWRKCLLYYLNK